MLLLIVQVSLLEGNLSLRISDIVRLQPCENVNAGGRYCLAVGIKLPRKTELPFGAFVIQSACNSGLANLVDVTGEVKHPVGRQGRHINPNRFAIFAVLHFVREEKVQTAVCSDIVYTALPISPL